MTRRPGNDILLGRIMVAGWCCLIRSAGVRQEPEQTPATSLPPGIRGPARFLTPLKHFVALRVLRTVDVLPTPVVIPVSNTRIPRPVGTSQVSFDRTFRIKQFSENRNVNHWRLVTGQRVMQNIHGFDCRWVWLDVGQAIRSPTG